MTATTPNYAIPYPEITDFVKDGATAMEAIAEKVDDILSTGAAARNLYYNGAMQVAQRGVGPVTGITSGTGSYHTADRWLTNMQSLGTFTQSVDTDVPTGQGFRNSLKMTCTSADAAPAAADFLMIQQRLEGLDCQAIRKGTANAQPLTVSFWVKSNKTGTYVFELYDNTNTRHCCKTYTINASATWEYKTITFPADTVGALANDNNMALLTGFILGAGSNRTSGTLATTWASYTAANEAVGQANLADTVNNYWQVTGVQLVVGSTAVPFEFKSYNEELTECQRYFINLYQDSAQWWGVGMVYPTNNAYLVIDLPVTMRTRPTSVTAVGTFAGLDSGGVGRGIGTPTLGSSHQNAIGLQLLGGFNFTNGYAVLIYCSSAPNYIWVNGAEL